MKEKIGNVVMLKVSMIYVVKLTELMLEKIEVNGVAVMTTIII